MPGHLWTLELSPSQRIHRYFLHSTSDPVNTHGYLKSELATHTYTSTCTHSPCLQALWAAPTYLSLDPSLPVLFFFGGGFPFSRIILPLF